MDWAPTAEDISLITPHIAMRFRVIPLGQEGNTVLLLTDEQLTASDLAKRMRAISFMIRKPARLRTLSDHPEFEYSFSEYLDRYYNCEFEEGISTPVSLNLMNVLLYEPRRGVKKASEKALEDAGFAVQVETNLAAALEILEGACGRFQFAAIAEDQKESVAAKFRMISNARVVTVPELLAVASSEVGLAYCCSEERIRLGLPNPSTI